MKKRIRKKKHLREFEKFGIIVTIDVAATESDEAIYIVNSFANAHGLYSWGGGFGRVSVQAVRKRYNVPNLVADLIFAIINEGVDKLVFCLYSPQQQNVPDTVKNELETMLASSPYKASISPKQVNLWHY